MEGDIENTEHRDSRGTAKTSNTNTGIFSELGEEISFDEQIKYAIIFFLTGVLLGVAVVAYIFLGAFYFKPIEAKAELKSIKVLKKTREALYAKMKVHANVDKENWKRKASKDLSAFEDELLEIYRKRGTSDITLGVWTISGSIVFCASVITTIGWGHVVPKTSIGRMSCIVYAVFGIPLLFSFTAMLSASFNRLTTLIWTTIKFAFSNMPWDLCMINWTDESSGNYRRRSERPDDMNYHGLEGNMRKGERVIESDKYSVYQDDDIFPVRDALRYRVTDSFNMNNYLSSLQSSLDFCLNAPDTDDDCLVNIPHYKISSYEDAEQFSHFLAGLDDHDLLKCMKYAGVVDFAKIEDDGSEWVSDVLSSDEFYRNYPRTYQELLKVTNNATKEQIIPSVTVASVHQPQSIRNTTRNKIEHSSVNNSTHYKDSLSVEKFEDSSSHFESDYSSPFQHRCSHSQTCSSSDETDVTTANDDVPSVMTDVKDMSRDSRKLYNLDCSDSETGPNSSFYYGDSFDEGDRRNFDRSNVRNHANESKRQSKYLKESISQHSSNRSEQKHPEKHLFAHRRDWVEGSYPHDYVGNIAKDHGSGDTVELRRFVTSSNDAVFGNKLNVGSRNESHLKIDKKTKEDRYMPQHTFNYFHCLPNTDCAIEKSNTYHSEHNQHTFTKSPIRMSLDDSRDGILSRKRERENIGDNNYASSKQSNCSSRNKKLNQSNCNIRIDRTNNQLTSIFAIDFSDSKQAIKKPSMDVSSIITDEETVSDYLYWDDEESRVPFIVYCLVTIGYTLIGGEVFRDLSTDKMYTDGIYFTVIMLTTIGFGDIVPEPQAYVALLLYGAIGLALANLVTNMMIEEIVDILEGLNEYWVGLYDEEEDDDESY